MRFTQVLRAQHLGFMTKRHWLVQGKRIVRETGARSALEAQGIKIVDAMKLAYPPPPRRDYPKIIGMLPEKPVFNKTHQFWNREKCHMFGNSTVLLAGMEQAQILTNTLTIAELPENIMNVFNKVNMSASIEDGIRSSIMNAHIFDAEQKKLAKRKIPNRPAFNLPRYYGITDQRRFRLLMTKLLFECEKLSGRTTTSRRKLLDDGFFVVPFQKEQCLIQMEINAETFITSKDPIVLDDGLKMTAKQLPDIFPLKCTVSMPQTNIYHKRDSYPLANGTSYLHPHTIILHYSPLDVFNLHESEVTATQYKARSMLKAFGVAAANARSQYGPNVKDLPKPVVVQSIHTDGQSFYFGVYQLNTLDLNSITNGTMNYWYNLPNTVDLFNECGYQDARPILNGYSNDVFKYIYAFYRNT